ncbi:Uncharacterised protein [Mycobacteroides abscessus subsp. bolletii]|nr:Uncharacterised protein [Mycobacteroides abscessus subsp. bolletii]SKJ86479.1 Uncharacterised protein [Mycobacteroides abscessus subsp. bolletii]
MHMNDTAEVSTLSFIALLSFSLVVFTPGRALTPLKLDIWDMWVDIGGHLGHGRRHLRH